MRAVAAESRESGLVTLSAGSTVGADTKAAESYLERVRAYIPVEILAFFIFVNSLVIGTVLSDPPLATATGNWLTHIRPDGFVALAALIIGALATLVYARLAARTTKEGVWGVQAAVSLVAFLIWTYALGARAYELIGLDFHPSVAGLLLATFTLFSGVIVPVKKPADTDPVVP